MLHDLLIARGIAHQRFEQLVKPLDVDQLNQSRQSAEPEQLCNIALRLQKHLKWEHRNEVDDEPAVEHIVLCNTLQVFDVLVSFRMSVTL